jgi:hypothetical protein
MSIFNGVYIHPLCLVENRVGKAKAVIIRFRLLSIPHLLLVVAPKQLAPHQESCKSRTKKNDTNNRDDTYFIFIDNDKKGVTKSHPVENNDKLEASKMVENGSVSVQKATTHSVATPGFNEGTYECSSCKKSFHPEEIARHRQSCYVKHQQVDQPSVVNTNISANILQVAFHTQRLGLYFNTSDGER